ncbi:MAG: biopolymer transporter ExbD [Holophagales bacterium]|nr:MAG: biopolymer transporter ExbD [Holophagales bacterium]
MSMGVASSKPGSGEAAVKSDINVTPLVDVCLVLLIIFMVVTPMLQKGVDVALPTTTEPEKMPEGAKQVDIAVKSDGKVFIGKDWIPNDQLEATFAEMYRLTPEKNLVIKGDKRLQYKDVQKVMKQLNKVGFTGVGLVTLKEDKSGAGGHS